MTNRSTPTVRTALLAIGSLVLACAGGDPARAVNPRGPGEGSAPGGAGADVLASGSGGTRESASGGADGDARGPGANTGGSSDGGRPTASEGGSSSADGGADDAPSGGAVAGGAASGGSASGGAPDGGSATGGAGTGGVAEPIPQNLRLEPVADASVDAAAPSVNFGTAATLLVDEEPNRYETILRFEVPPLTANVQTAKLRVYVVDESDDGPTVFITSSGWIESGAQSVTYDTLPDAAGGALGSFGGFGTGWRELDVTSAIHDAGPVSFLLVPDSTNGGDFSSREGTHAPELVIVTGASTSSEIEHVGTTAVYDADGQDLTIGRPAGSQAGDLFVLALHRTDDYLPLAVDGWSRVAECYKRDNGYDCATAADCTSWSGPFCQDFGPFVAGQDLAQAIFVRPAAAGEPSSYVFDLNPDSSGHPSWAFLTALRGADTSAPIRDAAVVGCDASDDSAFPSVAGQPGDLLLLSQSFDDFIAQANFGPPPGTTSFGYVGQSDETGFLFGGLLSTSGQTGTRTTSGAGGPACKDALVSLTIRPAP